jgi:transposase
MHFCLDENSCSDHLFINRIRRGDSIKILEVDADALRLFTKRLEEGQLTALLYTTEKIASTNLQLARPLDKWD